MQLLSRDDAKIQGLKRYFTGDACAYGHVAERRVSDYGCVECSRLKARNPRERERRREYMAAHQRQYRKEHPDRVRSTKLKHGQAYLNAQRRARRAKDPSKDRAALSRSFQKHKAKRMADARAWKEANRERANLHTRAAKAKRRAADGNFTRQDVDRLFLAQHGRCAACMCDISDGYHIDHIVPLSRGGTNWPSNLQLLCQPCNQSKGDKTMDEWISWWLEMARPRYLARGAFTGGLGVAGTLTK